MLDMNHALNWPQLGQLVEGKNVFMIMEQDCVLRQLLASGIIALTIHLHEYKILHCPSGKVCLRG